VKGYNSFKNNTKYEHHLVNHSISFVSTYGSDTNTIKGTWSGVKRTIPVIIGLKILQGKLFYLHGED
jgi:hypothetical protein